MINSNRRLTIFPVGTKVGSLSMPTKSWSSDDSECKLNVSNIWFFCILLLLSTGFEPASEYMLLVGKSMRFVFESIVSPVVDIARNCRFRFRTRITYIPMTPMSVRPSTTVTTISRICKIASISPPSVVAVRFGTSSKLMVSPSSTAFRLVMNETSFERLCDEFFVSDTSYCICGMSYLRQN